MSVVDVVYLESVAKNINVEIRCDLATELSHLVCDPVSDKQERDDVLPILMSLADDEVVAVRQTISEHIKDRIFVPRELLFSLMADISVVSDQLISSSPALSEADLMELVDVLMKRGRIALARRPQLNSRLAQALIEAGPSSVIEALLENENAVITPHGYSRIMELYGDRPSVEALMLKRSDLPLTLAESLVSGLSERLEGLASRMAPKQNENAKIYTFEAREKATILLSVGQEARAIEGLVRQLHDQNRLTPSIILRAAFMGNMEFVTQAIAFVGSIPVRRVATLLKMPGWFGLKSVCMKAGLSKQNVMALKLARDAAADLQLDGSEADIETFSRRMVERTLTSYKKSLQISCSFHPHNQQTLAQLLAAGSQH